MAIAVPEDYEQVTYEQAQQLVTANAPQAFDTNLAFFEGDHWQGGEGWPHAIDPSADGSEYLQSLIEEMFESKNVIREVVTRFLDGLLENTPEVNFAAPRQEAEEPSTEVEARVEAVNDELSRWIRQTEFLEEVREAIKYATMGHRGYLRPYIPPARRDEQGRIGGTYRDVFDALEVVAVKPTDAVIYTHPRTARKLAIYHYKPGDADEVEDPTREDTLDRVELGWIDPETGETVLRILKEGEDPEALAETPVTDEDNEDAPSVLATRELRLDLNGHLLLQEIELDQQITEQVRSSQKSLNLTKTMQTHNEIASGFSERMILNAQPPGEFVRHEDGSRKWEPNELPRGPFRTHFIQGAEVTGEMGQEDMKEPSVVFDEADDPDIYIRGKASKRKDILDEVSQTFVLMNEQSETSGRSRLIARHEFTKTLGKAEGEASAMIRAAVMSVTIMAGAFADGAPEVRDLRLPVELYPDSGPLTPAEMEALDTMTESGLMSMQTALSRAGIHDVEAEMQRIEDEENKRIQRLIERAKLIKELVAAGAALPGAAMVAGFDEDEAQELQTGASGDVAEAVASQAANGNPR